jgi:hypothetical protein
LLYPLSYGGWPEKDCGPTDHYEQRSGTLSPPVGIGQIPGEWRYQPPPFRSRHAQNGARSADQRTELDTGTAVDDKAGNRPQREWWPGYWRVKRKVENRTRGLAMRLRGGCESSRGSVRCLFAESSRPMSTIGLPT